MTLSTFQPQLKELFGFTDTELLWDRLTQERLLEVLWRENVKAVSHTVSYNNYGEFHFLTLQAGGEDGFVVRLYGLGFHELREAWVRGWMIYDVTPIKWQKPPLPQPLSKFSLDTALRSAYMGLGSDEQTQRGVLFSLLADLTDEDGAASMLDDMGWE